jgi:hypothetical protein
MDIIGVRKRLMWDFISECLHRLRVLFVGNPYKEPIKPLMALNKWKPADKVGLDYYDSTVEKNKPVKSAPDVLRSLERHQYNRTTHFGDSLWL